MAKRIGLLTLPLHTNYGGILQAVALRKALNDLGKEVVLLDREPQKSLLHHAGMAAARLLPVEALARVARTGGERPGWLRTRIGNIAGTVKTNRRKRVHQAFIAEQLPQRTRPLKNTDALRQALAEHGIDGVVVGSDQVWRVRYQPGNAVEDYFLGFAPDATVRKVSYAASFGVGQWEYPQHTATARRLLARFDAVSVREASAVEICESEFGLGGASHVVDPTLLVEPGFYDAMLGTTRPGSRPVILEYVLDPDPAFARLGADLEAVLGPHYTRRPLVLDSQDVPVDVPTWLRAFKEADFVVTDSFHGTVFSIIFRKNFIAVINVARGADRFLSLLSSLGLENRAVTAQGRDNALKMALEPIDYDEVERRLSVLRARSADFLQAALA